MVDKVQRLRLTFTRDDEARYLSHLDVMRMWERALKRAGLPIAYSEGFSPRPRIAVAAPIAVGVTSQAELIELLTVERLPLRRVLDEVPSQLPQGFRLLDVQEVARGHPSLQSMVRAASYEVEVTDVRTADAWRSGIANLLDRSEIPWHHMRGDERREYDLRPLILDITLPNEAASGGTGSALLAMRLRNDGSGSGRPEQVALALGVQDPPLRIHRTQLELEEPQIARTAYRAAVRD